MKIKIIGTGKKVIEISKRFGIEIIKNTKYDHKYEPALIIDDSCYYNIKNLSYEEIKEVIKAVQKA